MGLNLILFILLYLVPEEVSSDWSHNVFDLNHYIVPPVSFTNLTSSAGLVLLLTDVSGLDHITYKTGANSY